MTQQDCLRHAVGLLLRPQATPDEKLLLADALDELALQQRLSPIHAVHSDHSLALANALRESCTPPAQLDADGLRIIAPSKPRPIAAGRITCLIKDVQDDGSCTVVSPDGTHHRTICADVPAFIDTLTARARHSAEPIEAIA